MSSTRLSALNKRNIREKRKCTGLYQSGSLDNNQNTNSINNSTLSSMDSPSEGDINIDNTSLSNLMSETVERNPSHDADIEEDQIFIKIPSNEALINARSKQHGFSSLDESINNTLSFSTSKTTMKSNVDQQKYLSTRKFAKVDRSPTLPLLDGNNRENNSFIKSLLKEDPGSLIASKQFDNLTAKAEILELLNEIDELKLALKEEKENNSFLTQALEASETTIKNLEAEIERYKKGTPKN